MRRSIFLLSLVGIYLAISYGQKLYGESDDLPNIIVIYTDDQGFGDLSCQNPDAKFRTPNLDQLAKEGIRFTNAHSADTVCTPSRYALLTGRYCWRSRMKRGVLGAEAPCLIADDRLTIASMLKQKGYATAMVGKWHLGMDFPGKAGSRDWSKPVKDMPLDKGFDYFYGIPASLNYGILAWFEGRYAKTPPTMFTAKKPNKRHVDYRIMPPYQESPAETRQELGKPGFEIAEDFVDNQCLTRFTDKAIAWMKNQVAENSKQPFFLYLPYTSPHYPVCPLPEYWGKGNCGGYGEFMMETDDHVGRILKWLRDSKLDENTIVIFSSDNGPERSWESRIKKFRHDSRGGYRGGKRSIYEGGHRVPMIIRWPKGIGQPGRTCSDLVGQVDLIATLASIVDYELADEFAEDSCAFDKILSNAEYSHQRKPLINHGANGRFSITHGKWKLILPHNQLKRELYDLEKDPSENKNVIQQNIELADELENKIRQLILDGRTTDGQNQSNETDLRKELPWLDSSKNGSKAGKSTGKRASLN